MLSDRNLYTIFYAEPAVWSRSVVLLGFDVEVAAEPAGYGWRFGDGTSVSTLSPGAPYPAKDVVHRYRDAHVTVSARVDTAYQVRYRVDGGAWQTIADTVPAAGLPVGLRIREAPPSSSATDGGVADPTVATNTAMSGGRRACRQARRSRGRNAHPRNR